MEGCRFPKHVTKGDLPNGRTTTSQDHDLELSALPMQEECVLTMLCYMSSLPLSNSYSGQHLNIFQHADHYVVRQHSLHRHQSIHLYSGREEDLQADPKEDTE
jgi:hypothetical protein